MKMVNRKDMILRIAILCFFIHASDQQYQPHWSSLDKRPLPSWYDESKVGIFIHWGIFSVPSIYSEWMWWEWQGDFPKKEVLSFIAKNYPSDWTYADFAKEFRAELFDPNEWVDLFVESGAKYVVFTSKHHEGFTMWPSKYSFNWNSMDVGPKRDIVGDFANAVRNRSDLIFGLYHSMFEWFHPLYKYDRNNLFLTNEFARLKTLPELYEIVEKYRPALIWSDGDWVAPDLYWNSTKFLAWLYNDSPVKDTVVVNDRWGLGTICLHGGYHTCTDRFNPGHLIKHKWENALTIDKKSWGYRRTSNLSNYLTIEELIKEIVTTVSTGGNVLINVGPTAYGKIEPIYQERLRQMGAWLKINGEAIYRSVPWEHQKDKRDKNIWYTSSSDKKTVYAIILEWPTGSNEVSLNEPISSAQTTITLLGSNLPSLPWTPLSSSRGIRIDLSKIRAYSLQSNWAWVFKMTNVRG